MRWLVLSVLLLGTAFAAGDQALKTRHAFLITAHLEGKCESETLSLSVTNIRKFYDDPEVLVVCNSCDQENPQLVSLQLASVLIVHNTPDVTRMGFECAALNAFYNLYVQGDIAPFDILVVLQHTTYLLKPIPEELPCSMVPFYHAIPFQYDHTAQWIWAGDVVENILLPNAKRDFPDRSFRKFDDPTGGGLFGPNFIITRQSLELLNKWGTFNLAISQKWQAQGYERILALTASWLECPPELTSLDGEIGDDYPCPFWYRGRCPEDVVLRANLHLAKLWGTQTNETEGKCP